MIEFALENWLEILQGAGGVLLVTVGMKARKMLKTLTYDKVVVFAEQLIDRYIDRPDKLNTILTVISGLPIVRNMFNKGKDYADAYLMDLNAQILEWEFRINADMLTPEERAKAVQLIADLKQRQEKLRELNAEKDA